jgi:kynurenine/2-aminoadipate aminotransferase
MISLAGGMPNPSLFPIAGLRLTLRTGQVMELPEAALKTGMQYAPTQGVAEFVALIKAMTAKEHNPPYAAWDMVVTNGSQDALFKVFDVLLDEADTAVVELPSYPGALAALRPTGCAILGVEVDCDGIIPEKLRTALEGWKGEGGRTRPPKLLYLIPNGQNPTGATLSAERKKEVYQIACKHDMVIIEDDPYYNIVYEQQDLHPSFMSMDTQARVVRLDSLSKVLSSGIRVGYATGPAALIRKVNEACQASILHACSLSQVLCAAVLGMWKEEGWAAHIAQVKALYRDRAKAFHEMASRHLAGLAEWSLPRAGMFVWIRVHGVEDTKDIVLRRGCERKVLFVPGQFFSSNDAPSPFVRASFSVAPLDQMDEALRRFAEVLRAAKAEHPLSAL